jgi:hypothetical protein
MRDILFGFTITLIAVRVNPLASLSLEATQYKITAFSVHA